MLLNCGIESPLDCKEIQPVRPKGHQSWIFIGRTDAEAEAPVLWLPDAGNWLIGKDPDVGKDWGQEEEGMIEDEMVGWHHQLNEHELEQALRLVMDRETWSATVHGVAKSQTWHDWVTVLNKEILGVFFKRSLIFQKFTDEMTSSVLFKIIQSWGLGMDRIWNKISHVLNIIKTAMMIKGFNVMLSQLLYILGNIHNIFYKECIRILREKKRRGKCYSKWENTQNVSENWFLGTQRSKVHHQEV